MIDDKTNTIMRVLARSIDEFLNGKKKPKPFGFVLLVFPEEGPEGQKTNYISNCERDEVLAAMKEVVARFEEKLH